MIGASNRRARIVTTTRDVLKGTVDDSKFANQSMHRGIGARHPCRPARLTRSSGLRWLTAAALSVNAGGGSKQKMRWGEDGHEGQLEALAKPQEADPARRKCWAAVLHQSRLRPRRWPHSAAFGLLRKQCCAPDRSRARRGALRLLVQRGVPVPTRQATPSAAFVDNSWESWPGPSQTVAQHGPPYPSACRVVFHCSHIVMKTDILRCHAADQSIDHL